MTTETIAEIQGRNADARGRVIAAGADYFRSETGQSEQAPEAHAAGIVQAAMMELAAVWREEAAWFTAQKRKGHVTTSKELIQAAARLSGFAVGLTTRPVTPAAVIVAEAAEAGFSDCAHPADKRSTLKSGATICTLCQAHIGPAVTGDPTMDYLTGAVSTYEPTGAPVQPTPAADNPFTSPAAPGSNRAPVKRLTYGELPLLISRTYPVQRPHLSHSFVTGLEGCGLSALFSDASKGGHLGPRRPSWSLIGGNAFHLAIELVEKAAIALGGASPTAELGDWQKFWEEALTAKVDETQAAMVGTPYGNVATWHVANKGLEGYDWWRVQGLDMLNRYLALHDNAWRAQHTLLQLPADPSNPDSPRIPVVEFPFTTLAGSTSIAAEGFVDLAWMSLSSEYPMATLEVIDLKSGKSTPADPFQLVEYADVLRKHLPANFALPIVGRYYQARKGEYTRPVPLPAVEGQAEIDYRYGSAQRAMANGVFVASPSSFCAGCGSVDYCPTQSVRDAS